MSIYAYVSNGIVQEIIYPLNLEGRDIPIEERFNPEFLLSLVDITGITPMPQPWWLYDGTSFIDPATIPPDPEFLASQARAQRDSLLISIYDKGISMALRALRMATTPEQTAYAQGKVIELDLYAEALLAVPEQPGFPQTIVWPVTPTK